jgi:hypothetical protein
MQDYHELIYLIPNVLRRLLSIEAPSYMTCERLHRALFERKYETAWRGNDESDPETCLWLAKYLCLLMGKRCRVACRVEIAEHKGSHPLLVNEVANLYSIQTRHLACASTFSTMKRFVGSRPFGSTSKVYQRSSTARLRAKLFICPCARRLVGLYRCNVFQYQLLHVFGRIAAHISINVARFAVSKFAMCVRVWDLVMVFWMCWIMTLTQ